MKLSRLGRLAKAMVGALLLRASALVERMKKKPVPDFDFEDLDVEQVVLYEQRRVAKVINAAVWIVSQKPMRRASLHAALRADERQLSSSGRIAARLIAKLMVATTVASKSHHPRQL